MASSRVRDSMVLNPTIAATYLSLVATATLYASVSASFIVEQDGLPNFSLQVSENSMLEKWNGDLPERRLEESRARLRR